MPTTYAQKQAPAQKKEANAAASVVDCSSQGESLQRKADMANNAAQRAEAPRPNNTGMPDNLKSGIESLSGFSMDDVRVHYNSSKPATVQALAYTQGTDIHVAPGQEKCLPHEAWHVAQQMAGRVSPTTNINGMPVNDNAALEHEADVMGEKAVQCKMVGVNFTNGYVQSLAVQRMAFYNGSASETEQYEGNEDLAKMFGRKKKDDFGYKRPLNVARKVDQYKKEMLTYIASRIQNGSTKYYGPHISVVITRGIWFIAINSDYSGEKKDIEDDLKPSALIVKDEIKQKWLALQACAKKNESLFKGNETDTEGMPSAVNEKVESSSSDVPENIDEDIAKKQALYIVYRWAGKDNGIVVEHNKLINSGRGVVHGEMQTLGLLNNKLEMLDYAIEFFRKAKEVAVGTTAFDTAITFVDTAANKTQDAANKAKVADDKAIAKADAVNTQKEAQKEADKAQKAVEKAKTKIATDKAKVAELKAKVAELKVEFADLKVKFADYEVKVATLKAEDAELDAEYAAYEAKCRANEAVKKAKDGGADGSVMGKVVTAENYVKNAFGIVNVCCSGASTGDKKRVIRVGGTRTPCNDCAKEMGIHAIHLNDDDKDVHYEGACVKMVGNRIVSTMTSSSGKVFSQWKFKNLARKPIADVKNHDASYNPDQSQDYNELYDTFNSFMNFCKLKERMDVTENMQEIWFSRLKSYEEITKDCSYNDFLNSLIKLKKEDSLKLKDFFVRHMESLCAQDRLNSQTLSKQDSKQMVSVSISMQLPSDFEFLQDGLNDILKDPKSLLEHVEFDRLVIRRLDLNIQGNIVDEMVPSSRKADDDLIKEMDGLYFKGKQLPVMNQQVDYLDKTQMQLVQLQELLTGVSEISSFVVMERGDNVRQIVENLVNGDNGDLEDQGMKEWKNLIKLIDCLQKLVPAQKSQPLLLEIASGILKNLPSVLNGVKDTLINLKLTKGPIFLNLNSLKEILEEKTITRFASLKNLFKEYDCCIKKFPKVKKNVEDKLKRQTCSEELIREFIKYVTQFNGFISRMNNEFRDELNNLKLLTLCVSLLNPELKKIQFFLKDELKSEERYMKAMYIPYLKAKKDKEKK